MGNSYGAPVHHDGDGVLDVRSEGNVECTAISFVMIKHTCKVMPECSEWVGTGTSCLEGRTDLRL